MNRTIHNMACFSLHTKQWRTGDVLKLLLIIWIGTTFIDGHYISKRSSERDVVQTMSCAEDAPVGTDIGMVKHKQNATLLYAFDGDVSMSQRPFHINPTSGWISVYGPLDYEEQTSYRLTVFAHSRADPSSGDKILVYIHILNINDNYPEIVVLDPKEVTVTENQSPSETIAVISVTDRDIDDTINCILSGHHVQGFTLNRINIDHYVIRSAQLFDREFQDTYNLTVTCRDSGELPHQTTLQLTVHVRDMNDNIPVFTKRSYQIGDINESVPIGTYIITISAIDRDLGENGRISYYIPYEAITEFKIDPITGVITTNARLDYETKNSIEFTVLARDNGKPTYSATATVSVGITDSDEGLVFTKSSWQFEVREKEPSGTVVGKVVAVDNDSGPNVGIIYTYKPDLDSLDVFEIGSETGIITTRRMLLREHQTEYKFNVLASNPGPSTNQTSTANVVVNVLEADVDPSDGECSAEGLSAVMLKYIEEHDCFT